MTARVRQIEVDSAAAAALAQRAAERRLTVAELLAERVGGSPPGSDADSSGELERRWAAIVAGGPTGPREDVVRWLDTWGSPDDKPWPAS